MKYGSLFSGAGGLDLAIEEVFGAECAWQCEYDTAECPSSRSGGTAHTTTWNTAPAETPMGA